MATARRRAVADPINGELGALDFTEEERAFAHTLAMGYPEQTRATSLTALEIPADQRDEPLLADFLPPTDIGKTMSGSTDAAEVSWLAPTVQITTTCWAPGVPGHSWGITASGGMSIGHKGMLHAAKAMAPTATMLHDDPATIARAKEEYREALGGRSYQAPLPEGAMPPLPRG